jgi:hypothetical protein
VQTKTAHKVATNHMAVVTNVIHLMVKSMVTGLVTDHTLHSCSKEIIRTKTVISTDTMMDMVMDTVTDTVMDTAMDTAMDMVTDMVTTDTTFTAARTEM